jgi:plasmid stabilization system protein ParE
MKLQFHPAVQRDVNGILAYYEREASAVLADRFFSAMQIQLEKIAKHPERYSPYPPANRFQRAFIPGFPHIILFRRIKENIRILTIKHEKQHPRQGLTRW